jgi:hypothetical protein
MIPLERWNVERKSLLRVRYKWMITNPIFITFNRPVDNGTYFTFHRDFATWNVVKEVVYSTNCLLTGTANEDDRMNGRGEVNRAVYSCK